jgi:hypothetical protein
MDQDNAAMNGVWSSLRSFLIAIGSALVTGGVITNTSPVYTWIMFASGAVLVVGPAAYGVFVNIKRVINSRKKVAEAVQAGINLTVSGQALAADGKTIVSINDGTTPPLPVTLQSAAQIVRDFAPATPAKAT